MATARRIIVVDDHFETLESLRSLLEQSDKSYQVTGFPSAEEGWLEMRQGSFDLLITDIDLPGMNGYELAKKVIASRPEVPIVMITAHTTEERQRQAAALGLSYFLTKPLNTDNLLTIVHSALYGASEVMPQAADEAVAGDLVGIESNKSLDHQQAKKSILSPRIRKRIEALRTDTGAVQIMMATVEGDLLYVSGSLRGLDLPVLANSISANIRGSFDLAKQLERDEPFTIQYQAGKNYDLYSANVGKSYYLAIFFDAHARRGRIGTVWVFAQRAIGDLMALLTAEAPETVIEDAQTARQKSPVTEDLTQVEEPAKEQSTLDAEETQATAFTALDIPPELLREEFASEGPDIDLETFWDEALSEASGDEPMSTGISLEEARQKGIISSEFDADDDS